MFKNAYNKVKIVFKIRKNVKNYKKMKFYVDKTKKICYNNSK